MEQKYKLTYSPAAKTQIMRKLGEEGYPTYASLLNYFDVYLTSNPEDIAYMIPGKAAIIVNSELSIDQVSTVVRHEILHEYLTHMQRKEKVDAEHPGRLTSQEIANIAADFDISNVGYTERDKNNTRRIKLGDNILAGLVTEDQMPGWEDLTFEEMYNKLADQNDEAVKKSIEALKKIAGNLSPKDIEDLEKQIEDIQEQQEQQEQQNQQNQQNQQSQQNQQGQQNQQSQADKVRKDLQDQTEKAAKELDDVKDNIPEKDPNKPFGSDADQQKKSKLGERVKEIKKILGNIEIKQQILNEIEHVKGKERIEKVKKSEYARLRDPLTNFRLNLNRFIRDQLGDMYRGSTWHRPNKNYGGSDYIMPGRSMFVKDFMPSINVYWDVSGSFSDPRKTEGARQAIATLNEYARKGKIKINVYYHADRVSDNKESAGGGNDGGAILDHINDTKPTNVIIISDDNIDSGVNGSYATVPGAVWVLFYGTTAEEFMQHIKGKKETKEYFIPID